MLIYVALRDEAVEVWRSVDATPLSHDVYRMESHNADPKDERWQFQN